MRGTTVSARGGFTLLEVLVVIGLIMLLIGILLPSMEKVRHRGYVDVCASNLRQIGEAMEMYAIENHGALPRTTYVPGATPVAGTGAASANPFAPGGPQANDVSAAAFLLLRSERLPAAIFICPYNDVQTFEADRADPAAHANFTDYHRNLGYSFSNPYPDDAAVQRGYKWTNHRAAAFALAGDRSCGTRGGRGDDVRLATPTSSSADLRRANSANHEKEAQNVLFGDGHVSYEHSVFCGADGDNIYTNQLREVYASPVGKYDSVLLPTDD